MFDAISRWLCKLIFTNAFIEKLINETLQEYLNHKYGIFFVDEMPSDLLDIHQSAQNMDGLNSDGITAITFTHCDPDYGDELGEIVFNIECIKHFAIGEGFFDGMQLVRDIVMHECRHADQFEFLRSRGGSELIKRVTEDQKDVPYIDNILEVDAYHYQFTGEKLDFEVVFEKYL